MYKTKMLLSPYEQQQNRKRIMFAFLALFAFFAILPLFIPALAEEKQVIASGGQGVMNFFDGLLRPGKDVSSLLKIKQDGDAIQVGKYTLTTAWNVVDTVNKVFRNVALAIVGATFCISYMQSFINGSNYEELTGKKLIVLGIAVACIFNVQTVCMQLNNFGSELVDAMASQEAAAEGGEEVEATTSDGKLVYESNDGDNDPVFKYYKSNDENIAAYQQKIIDTTSYPDQTGPAGWTDWAQSLLGTVAALPYLMTVAMPAFVNTIANVLTQAVLWGRVVEMLITIALAPLAFVNFGANDSIERFMRFIRHFFALVLQGVIVWLIIVLGQNVRLAILGQGTTDGTIAESLWMQVVVAVVQFGLVAQSRQLSQSIIGT